MSSPRITIVILTLAASLTISATTNRQDTNDRLPSATSSAAAAVMQLPPQCPACVFGPQTYQRLTGAPRIEMAAFVADPAADYLIDIDDRGSQGADGSVILNGEALLAPRTAADVGPRHVRRAVVLRAQNALVVRLTGKPGSSLIVYVLGGAKSVGATGGTVRVPGGGIRIDIPPTALQQDTEISIIAAPGNVPPDYLEGTQPLGAAWSLEPHGLQFALPVTVSADYSGVLGQVGSPDEIGVVHWDPQATYVDVATATDDRQSHRLSFALDNFSNVGFVNGATATGFSLYKMRWGIPLLRTSTSSEFGVWSAETDGIAFTTSGQPDHIVIHRVTLPASAPCPAGYVELRDTLSKTCLPSLTRVLGTSDQAHIWLITEHGNDPPLRMPNGTVLRHAIGHALGIAHPWRMPPQGVPVMAPITQSGCDVPGVCLPIKAWTLFSRSGLHLQDVAAIQAKYGPPAPPAPTLLTPLPGAQIPQNDPSTGCSLLPNSPTRGFGFKIAFDWENVPGVTQYRLVAKHQSAVFPIVDVVIPQSNYTYVSCNAFVFDTNLTGWSWQVQSFSNGGWGAFSGPRLFEFLPCRLSDGTPCRS